MPAGAPNRLCVSRAVAGVLNVLLLLGALTIFVLGVFVGMLPRINSKIKAVAILFPQISPFFYFVVVLTALVAVVGAIFGIVFIGCAKNAPNCSKCCALINIIMEILVLLSASFICGVAIFFSVTEQNPACPIGNFSKDSQPDIWKCPVDSISWSMMQPDNSAYSNWQMVQNSIECCGYFCGESVVMINSTEVCTSNEDTKWQITGPNCGSQNDPRPVCRDRIVQFFDEEWTYVTITSVCFVVVLVALIIASFTAQCSIQMDNDRPTLRMELPSIREIVKRPPKERYNAGKLMTR